MENTEEENSQYLLQVIYSFANTESFQLFRYAASLSFSKMLFL